MKEEISIVDETGRPKLVNRLLFLILHPAVFFGPGLLVDSRPMQWAGFCMFWFCLIGVCLHIISDRKYMPLKEAEQKLNALKQKKQSVRPARGDETFGV